MAGEGFALLSNGTNGTHGSNGTRGGYDGPHSALLDVLHFNFPWALLLIFLTVFVANSVATAESPARTANSVVTGPGGKPLPRSTKKREEKLEQLRRQRLDFSPLRKLAFYYLSAGLIATFLANAASVAVHAVTKRDEGWWCGKPMAIYVCSCAFLYCLFLISLYDCTPSPNVAHFITWVVALAVETVLLVATILLYTVPHEEINSLRKQDEKDLRKTATDWEATELAVAAIRVIILTFLVAFYIVFSLERCAKNRISSSSDETAPLLVNGHANGNPVHSNGTIQGANGYTGPLGTESGAYDGSSQTGSTTDDANGDVATRKCEEDENPGFYKPTTAPNRTWYEYLKSYSVFFPYLWPHSSPRLQLIVLVCFIIIVLQRAVNIAVPLQIGIVTNQLSDKDGGGMPWKSISLLIAFKFLQGTSGILGAIRSVLWIPISQYSYQALTTASFEHVHSLSLDFHLGKRTGEVLSALNKGNAINNFLEQVTFQVVPMVFDLGVAIVYFGYKFDAYYALAVSIVTFAYLYLTVRMARWRGVQRREMTNLAREEAAVKNDSLTSYETVKYFNAEDYEFKRYRSAVTAFQKMEYQVTISLNILNISQNMVFMTGLLATSFIAAYQVTIHERQVGDFVSLMTYMAQLQQPLNFFGSFYRGVQSAMISGERLLELFKEQPTVVDGPNSKPMPTCEGAIRFQNVKFSYDTRKPALEGLTFDCRPGTTTAFVGESGGGKSTVFRLLFRFYDAISGSIQVDGNDVRDITLDSLRRHIGVVPQDTVLFNETIMYNLRYSNPHATDDDIYAACRAASIHDKILAMPDGYDTRVGERGLRLSGGEKQRVAIARTIIKNPRIIMLDEATAALDSDTEQNIQEALKTLSHGRTMLVIAHRLSTVTTADQILVLHAGKVAEAGSHQELLALKGRYANMWRKQIRAERAAEAASQMVAKAEALQKAAMERPSSSGNEGGPSADVSDNEADNRTLAQSSELQHSRSSAQSALDVSSPTGRSQAGNTAEGDMLDDKSDRSSSPPRDSQVDDTLTGSKADEGGKETPDAPGVPKDTSSNSQNLP